MFGDHGAQSLVLSQSLVLVLVRHVGRPLVDGGRKALSGAQGSWLERRLVRPTEIAYSVERNFDSLTGGERKAKSSTVPTGVEQVGARRSANGKANEF